MDLAIVNGSVYIDDKFIKTNIYIKNRRIVRISPKLYKAKKIIDASGLEVLPGLIDPHVHFDLGVGTNKSIDSFLTGSIAAIFGGVTTIVDFLDPASNATELVECYKRRKKQASRCMVNYRFHACLKEPDEDLEEFVKKMVSLGIYTLKIFTTYSDTKRNTSDENIIKLLQLSKKYHFMILAHVENDEMITLKDNYSYKDLTISRPSIAETSKVLTLANMVKQYGGCLYIVHCSSGNTMQELKTHYSDILGVNLFVESCPQYFLLNDKALQKEDGYLYTFAPPLRSEKEMTLLKDHIDDINVIGTDHCPYYFKDKKNHPMLIGCPMGIGGIEFAFPLLYKLFGEKIINKMSKNTAKIDYLDCIGSIKVGNFANISIFKKGDVVVDEFHGASDYSVYKGMMQAGEFIDVIINGKVVLSNRGFIGGVGKYQKQSEVK